MEPKKVWDLSQEMLAEMRKRARHEFERIQADLIAGLAIERGVERGVAPETRFTDPVVEVEGPRDGHSSSEK